MISRELIIIPPDGEKSSKYQKKKVLDRHHDILISYISENAIDIVIANEASIYNLGIEMAFLNYIVVGTDGKQLFMFLPVTLTAAQSKWFKDYRKVIISCEVYVINVIKGENINLDIEHIEEDETGISPVNRLFKVVKDKTIKEDKEKVKKYGNK